MKDGRRIGATPPLADIRAHAARELARLPIPLQRLESGADYPVTISAALEELARKTGR
jgi:nicotinate phosphoribosyltransferase